jgi:hypothetical protein
MPNKDGTGPEGKGSKTGRKRGNCEGAEAQEDNKNSRRGFGRRPRGRGLGQNR